MITMDKIDLKEAGLTLLLGSGIIVLTPLIEGFTTSINILSTEVIPGYLSIGRALSAGVATFVLSIAIDKWLK
jgi:hypothetical protein